MGEFITYDDLGAFLFAAFIVGMAVGLWGRGVMERGKSNGPST